MSLKRIVTFFRDELWKPLPEGRSWLYRFMYSLFKKLLLAVRFFTTKGVMDRASSLTYSTLLAIVPVVAVVFAIARGFGFSKYIEVWFRDALSSQPQAADAIIGFVNSYLVHARSGIILGIGLVFMLWTVLMLTRNVEQAFNNIWQVKSQRSFLRRSTDYLAVFFLVPIVIVLMSGLSLFVTTIADKYVIVGPFLRFLLRLMPYVLMSAVFVGMYMFMPNTRVRFMSALVPGVLAGVAMQILQWFYIYAQILLSSYNAIYGSFAALPLFMLWVQISWTICLFGAELSYTNQNLEEFSFLNNMEDMSNHDRLVLSATLLGNLCRRLEEGGKPYTALQLKNATGIPVRITTDLLQQMVKAGLINESITADADAETVYQPALSPDKINMGVLAERLNDIGEHPTGIDIENYEKALPNDYTEVYQHYLDELKHIKIEDLSDKSLQ